MPSESPGYRLIHVLHVDDEEDFLEFVKTYMEQEFKNLRIDTLSSPEKILQENILEKKDYDVIVSDYQMPLLNGLDLLVEVRKRGYKTAFIIFTGRGREDVAIRALNLGADYYLQKGYPEVALTELNHIINSVALKKYEEEHHLKIEQALRESEEKYSNLFHYSNDAIIMHSLDGRILDVNKKALNLFEYTEYEFKLNSIPDLHPPEMLTISKNAFETIAKKNVVRFEIEFNKKGGETFPAEVSSSLFELGGKKVIQGIIRDMTEQKQSEMELRENEALYRRLFEESPVALYEEDFSDIKVFLDNLKQKGINNFRKYFNDNPESVKHCASLGKVLNVNKTALKMAKGTNKDEFIGRLDKLFREESYEAFKEELIAISEGKTHFVTESASRSLEGDYSHYNLRMSVLPGYEESLSKILVSSLDITDLKQTEEELRISEERYRTLFTTMSEGIWVTNREDKTIIANPALEKMLGYSFDELIGSAVKNFLHPDSLTLFEERTKERYLKGVPSSTYELIFIRKDGTQLAARVAGTALYDQKGEIVGTFGVLSDMTQQKKIEDELRLFKSIIDNSNEAISISSADGNLVYINPAHKKLFGRSIEEASELSYRDYYPTEILERVEREIIPTLSTSESWEGVLDVVDYSGRRFPLWERVDSIRDPETGKVLYNFGLMHDVTEENMLKEQLQKQKEELELYVDIITHDLRNYQYVSKSYLDLISEKNTSLEIEDLLKKARKGVVQSDTLLNNISILMRKTLPYSYSLEYINLNDTIDVVIRSLGELFPSKNIEIIHEIPSNSVIIADLLFEQLLLNILTNSVKFDENDTVRIEISFQKTKDGKPDTLHICDHAKGIHPDERSTIFKRYTAFRAKGKGSGLGLYIVKTIADRYNWNITLENRVPDDYTCGTCFIIKFPYSN
ncbi:MAG: PAS domain S-box protein [Candidatus Hodarchaeales archaeon]|jgi:PAS domain S-box-containing protein